LELEKLVDKCRKKWSVPEIKLGEKAIEILKYGSKTTFKREEPSNFSNNARSAFRHGEQITDTVADWVKKKYVAGPFDNPLFNRMCINPLMAHVRKIKVCPILNLSAPENLSFNDAVNVKELRKLTMSSARIFGQGLQKYGKGAKFAKFDMIDAYKLIPSSKNDWKFSVSNGWENSLSIKPTRLVLETPRPISIT